MTSDLYVEEVISVKGVPWVGDGGVSGISPSVVSLVDDKNGEIAGNDGIWSDDGSSDGSDYVSDVGGVSLSTSVVSGIVDETSAILKDFIRQIENQLNQKVKTIRCDNGTEFKNRDIIEFCGLKGIKREYSNARTPQQNGVAERKNRTLIEAARTMLADSFLPNTFWAEAVSTACYVFAGKSDEGFLVGYSLQSKAFRVYNLVTKRVEENLHINFLENKPNVAGKGPNWLFDLDYLTDSMNYHSVRSENQANLHAGQQESNQNTGTKDKIGAGDSEKEVETDQDCFELPIWHSYSSTKKGGPREEEQVFLDDLARLQRQEKEANEEAEALKNNLEQQTENLVTQTETRCTPIETQKPLVKDEEANDVDVHLYRSMIGSLMYVTASRPDIMFADVHAYHAKELPISSPDPITPPAILTPSLVLPPSLLFNPRYFFIPEKLLPPKKRIHSPSSSSTTLSNSSQNQTCDLVSPSFSVYTSTPPQVFEIGKYSDKRYLKHHEKQVKYILNYLDELHLHRIEKMEEGRINGNELKTKLKKIRTQIIKLQKKQLGQKDKIAFAHYRISDLERIIEKIQARYQTGQEDL
ncbi:putative ribonuclease H-like domain-containing protein [Tanacetum coccineum]